MNKGYKEKEKKSSAIQMHSFLLELPNFCDFCCHPLLTFRFRPLQLHLIIIMLNIKGTHFKAAEIYDTVHDSRCSDDSSWETCRSKHQFANWHLSRGNLLETNCLSGWFVSMNRSALVVYLKEVL